MWNQERADALLAEYGGEMFVIGRKGEVYVKTESQFVPVPGAHFEIALSDQEEAELAAQLAIDRAAAP